MRGDVSIPDFFKSVVFYAVSFYNKTKRTEKAWGSAFKKEIV